MKILQNTGAGARCGRPPRAREHGCQNAPPERGRAAQKKRKEKNKEEQEGKNSSPRPQYEKIISDFLVKSMETV